MGHLAKGITLVWNCQGVFIEYIHLFWISKTFQLNFLVISSYVLHKNLSKSKKGVMTKPFPSNNQPLREKVS